MGHVGDPGGQPDAEVLALAERVGRVAAEMVVDMRKNSLFAVRAFLDAYENEVDGTKLVLMAPERKKRPPEAAFECGLGLAKGA